MFGNIARALATAFSYDAIKDTGRRRAIGSRVVREDQHTKGRKRTKLQETAAELSRNLSLAAWMIRRHLDYVARFDFHARTDIPELDDQIETLMRIDSSRNRCDVAARFGREKLFRVAELRRVLDGDTFLIKLRDGRLQGIQADLVKNPGELIETTHDGETVDGVQITGTGRAVGYALHARTSNTDTEFSRVANAFNVIHYGFFDRYATDQVRGVSPLVSALNPLRDVYENFDYALAKAKVSQLFALAFYRDAETSAGALTPEGDEEEPTGYQVDFGSGPQLLDLDPGDKAEFLESRTPSAEFQNFTQLVIQVALKALDIPYSFYDESHTNFFGSRAAWLHYDRSCMDKREDQQAMREDYTRFKLATWIRDGRLTLPRGWRVGNVATEWVPRGLPWFDTNKEVNGTINAIRGGLDNPQRACRATGSDFYDNIDQIARARDYALAKGVPLEFALAPQQIEVVEQ